MTITAIGSHLIRDLSSATIGLSHAARREETTARNGRNACRSAAAFVRVIVNLRDAYAAAPLRSPDLRASLIEAMRAAASDAMADVMLQTDSADEDRLVSFYDRVGADRDRMMSFMPRAFAACDRVFASAVDRLSILDLINQGDRTAGGREALDQIRTTVRDLRKECASATISGAQRDAAAADDSLRFDIADVLHFVSRLASGKDVLPPTLGEPQVAKLQRAADALEARRAAAAALRICADHVLEAIESERF